MISILKNGEEVASAEADDWEEPSSLSAFYRETATTEDEFMVVLKSRLDDTISAKAL